MKKILFSLVALMCSMSMNAQVMKVMKDGEVVATFSGAEYKFVFERASAGQPYSVKFEIGDPRRGNSDFTGFGSNKLTASNDDVTVELVLSGSNGRNPEWNDMGGISMGLGQGYKLTITVTPKNSGVTVTGIEYIHNYGSAKVTKTGAGPWEFDVADDHAYDGSTQLGDFYGITVNYTK